MHLLLLNHTRVHSPLNPHLLYLFSFASFQVYFLLLIKAAERWGGRFGIDTKVSSEGRNAFFSSVIPGKYVINVIMLHLDRSAEQEFPHNLTSCALYKIKMYQFILTVKPDSPLVSIGLHSYGLCVLKTEAEPPAFLSWGGPQLP